MSNFSISHSVFYSIRSLYPHLSTFLTLYLYLLLNWKSLKVAYQVKGKHFITQSQHLTTLKEKAFENIVGRGENAGNSHFLLFPQCFLLYQIQKSLFCELSNIFHLQMPSNWSGFAKFCGLVEFNIFCNKSLPHNTSTVPCVNLFPNKACFFLVCSTSHLKTLWEKEKLLLMSNFSFSHSVFYPYGELSAFFREIENCRLQTLSV